MLNSSIPLRMGDKSVACLPSKIVILVPYKKLEFVNHLLAYPCRDVAKAGFQVIATILFGNDIRAGGLALC